MSTTPSAKRHSKRLLKKKEEEERLRRTLLGIVTVLSTLASFLWPDLAFLVGKHLLNNLAMTTF